MKNIFKLNAIFGAFIFGSTIGVVHAQTTTVDSRVNGYTIRANNDGTNNTENLSLQSGNGGGSGAPSAYVDITSDGNINAAGVASIYITGNTDNSGSAEGVFIKSNASASVNINTGIITGSYVNVGTDGIATVAGAAYVGVNSNGTVDIGTVGTTINLGRDASTNNIRGTTNITGTTSINTSGSLNTTIGNAANITYLNSSTNNIGTGAYTTTNNMGSNQATNNITGVNNNIQGPLNNIGTSSVSSNFIGNASTNTTVTATAGNARQALANNSANTTVTGGASSLTARTGTANVTTTGQVLLSNTGGTTVDANGKILTSAATGPTAAVTLTNGYGNTHGLVVTESQTTLSGGTQSSSMTLTDRAATFSNAQTGAPITVTGVVDGRADFDAINVRQFAGAIAAVAAQANIPALAAGQDRTFGMGLGNFMGKSALAMGISMRGNQNSVYKATVSSGLNNGMKQTVVGLGGAWGF